MATVDEAAARRLSLRRDAKTSRPLSQGYERVGVIGEQWFRDFVGAPPVGLWRDQVEGDGGEDISLLLDTNAGPQWFRVDVKTHRRPYNLIVERGKAASDIFVLLGYDDSRDAAYGVGWQWGTIVRRWPVRDFGYGVMNHFAPARDLRKLDEIRGRMIPGGYRITD